MMKKLFSMLMFSIISAATALAYTDGILWQGISVINGWGSSRLVIDKDENTDVLEIFNQKLTMACDIYLKVENPNNGDLRISGQWGDWAATALPYDGYNHMLAKDGDNVVKVALSQEFVTKAFAEKNGFAIWGNGGFNITAIATSKEALGISSGNNPSGKEYRLVWSDDFNDGLSNWNVEVVPAPYNNELQSYRTENVTVENGNLVLTARRESADGKAFTSGRINSQGKVYFTHGKIEARIKMPRLANGLWPAFWMMGNDIVTNDWPACGEIDIMEAGEKTSIYTNTQERHFGGTIHWGANSGAHQQWNDKGFVTNSYDITGDYHTFTAVWDDTNLKFYLDDSTTPYYEATIKGYESEAYFHKPFHILFNLAVGGDFPEIYDPDYITALSDANGNEAKMYVDYVRVYQLEGEENITYVNNDAQGSNTIPAAPVPTHSQVMSIFSDQYEPVGDGDFDTWGCQGESVTKTQLATGDKAAKVSGFNYLGFNIKSDYGTINVSEMTHLHADIYVERGMEIGMTPIWKDPSNDYTKNQECVIKRSLNAGWNAVDIALSDYTTGNPNIKLDGIHQIKWEGGDGTATIYIDNVYFYKNVTDGISSAVAPKGRNEGWYNLSGSRLSGKPQAKGIYLHGGKAVVVK